MARNLKCVCSITEATTEDAEADKMMKELRQEIERIHAQDKYVSANRVPSACEQKHFFPNNRATVCLYWFPGESEVRVGNITPSALVLLPTFWFSAGHAGLNPQIPLVPLSPKIHVLRSHFGADVEANSHFQALHLKRNSPVAAFMSYK